MIVVVNSSSDYDEETADDELAIRCLDARNILLLPIPVKKIDIRQD